MNAVFSAAVGVWGVEVGAMTGVLARHRDGAAYSASLTRFPTGYRVSKVWSNGVQTATPDVLGVPRAVVAKANALANRLTKEVPL